MSRENNYPWFKYYKDMRSHIEYPDTSMYDLVRRSALKHPANIAYTYFGNKVTYKSFLIKIDTASRAFISIGVKKGDVVSIIMFLCFK